MLCFAALLSECSPVERDALFRHWWLDMSPDTLCLLARATLDALPTGVGTDSVEDPQQWLPCSAILLPVLQLFAVHLQQLTNEGFRTYRFAGVDTSKMSAEICTLFASLAADSGQPDHTTTRLLPNAVRVSGLLVQLSMTAEEKVDAIVSRLSMPLNRGSEFLLGACMRHLLPLPSMRRAVRHLSTLADSTLEDMLRCLWRSCLQKDGQQGTNTQANTMTIVDLPVRAFLKVMFTALCAGSHEPDQPADQLLKHTRVMVQMALEGSEHQMWDVLDGIVVSLSNCRPSPVPRRCRRSSKIWTHHNPFILLFGSRSAARDRADPPSL